MIMANSDWNELSPEEAYFQAALQLAQYKLIQKEIPSQNACEEEDEELDQRVMRMIVRETGKQPNTKTWSSALRRTLKAVAAAVLILNLCAVTAFALSSDFRNRVFQLFVATYPDHSDIGINPVSPEYSEEQSSESIPAYRLTWLPSDHYTIAEETASPAMYSITYLFENDAHIILDVCSADATGAINTENMDASSVTINGREIRVFRNDRESFLIWQENEVCFSMNTRNLTETEALLAMMSVSPAVDLQTVGQTSISE